MNGRKASNARTPSWLWSALLLAFLSACLATDVVVRAGDCGAREAVCGDFHCDSGDSVASCPGDCTP